MDNQLTNKALLKTLPVVTLEGGCYGRWVCLQGAFYFQHTHGLGRARRIGISLVPCPWITQGESEGLMPKKIETVFEHHTDTGETGKLGIDEDARLYWNDEPVITEQKITLQWWVNVAIIIASISTFALALFSVLEFFGYKSEIETSKQAQQNSSRYAIIGGGEGIAYKLDRQTGKVWVCTPGTIREVVEEEKKDRAPIEVFDIYAEKTYEELNAELKGFIEQYMSILKRYEGAESFKEFSSRDRIKSIKIAQSIENTKNELGTFNVSKELKTKLTTLNKIKETFKTEPGKFKSLPLQTHNSQQD